MKKAHIILYSDAVHLTLFQPGGADFAPPPPITTCTHGFKSLTESLLYTQNNYTN